jgi:predicted methyltransferase
LSLRNVFTYDLGNSRMVLDKADSDISAQIKKEGWYLDEKFDTEVFQWYLKTGMTFVDLGANMGFYTIFGSTIVGKKMRVYAFEPFPRNVQLINASIKQNSFTNVFVVQAAVSDKTGKTTLHLSPDASSEHSQSSPLTLQSK